MTRRAYPPLSNRALLVWALAVCAIGFACASVTTPRQMAGWCAVQAQKLAQDSTLLASIVADGRAQQMTVTRTGNLLQCGTTSVGWH